MMDMRAFAESENLSIEWKAVEKHFSAQSQSFKCSFVVGLPYFSLQGKITKLSSKTLLNEESVWIPALEALPVFEKALNKKFFPDSSQGFVLVKESSKEKSPAKVETSPSPKAPVKKSPEKNASTKNSNQGKKVVIDDRKAKAGSRAVKTIIIDPGHGGKDPGASGSKSQEKDIVLSVGKKLKANLEASGFEAILTRDKDVFIELSERPNIANRKNGDLFISLHCNAIDGEERKKKTHGYHFYVLRAPESEEDKAIARRENKVASLYGEKNKTEISPIEWIKIEASLSLYQQNSFRYTEELLKSFENGKIRRLGTGAGGAGFMVLVGALMPAVLVELGFITHPEDEAFMMSEKGQIELAEKISLAVKNYRDLIDAYLETLQSSY